MSGRGNGEAPNTVGAALRARLVIPLVLLGLVLVYELLWKGTIITPGSLAARIANVMLFLVVGPVMAWWGQSVARLLLQKLARSEAASEEKNRFLEQRNLQLQTVLQASRTMTSVLDFDQVANLAVGQVAAYTRFTRAALILGPDEQGQFALGAAHGLPEEFLQAFLPALTGPLKASSPVEWCQLTRQPVVVENVAKDFRTAGMRGVFALARAEGLIAVPLVLREQFRGSLIVFLEKSSPIATAEISLISALASQATLALENARLYTLTMQNRARLDQALELLQGLAGALARSRAGVSPLLHQVAQSTARLFAPASVRLMVHAPGQAAPQTVTETVGMEGPGGKPHVSLPVQLDGTEFGYFELYLAGEGRTLDDEELQILQAFVCLTASGLDYATAVREMHQAVR